MYALKAYNQNNMNINDATKAICNKHNIHPKRSKGQNFLVNEDVYENIVNYAGIKNTDKILEVGPGLGFLTQRLSETAKEVLAVELDNELYKYLEYKIESEKLDNVQLINEDILKFDIGQMGKEYLVVANLPYNITSYFLRTIYSAVNKPKLMVLMLQKEVAERIVAKAPRISMLGVSVQFYADAEIVRQVKASSFWPVPKVDSAIIKLVTKKMNDLINEDAFFQLVKAGFSAKRKQLKNNLVKSFNISQKDCEIIFNNAGIKINSRAQELSLEKWFELFGIFKKFVL